MTFRTFLESDYLERDPYRKLTVGLSHAFGGALLITANWSIPVVIGGYFLKEILFDLWRVWRGGSSKWLVNIWADRCLVADSLVDWSFWWLGATMAQSGDARYGFAALVVGAAYFAAGEWFDDSGN